MVKKKSRFDEIPLESREIVAENMKERVYSTITLLAVLAAMWQSGEHDTTLGAIASIAGAVVAVWLATLISTRMSYRAVHGKAIDRKDYVKTFFTSSGLLAPAITPILVILLGALTHWFDLQTALFVGMIISLLSLFSFSFVAGRKIYDNFWRLMLVSALEMSVGIGVILLKLAVGK